jgi:O-antigen/teichoic acid export membrane protein
VRRPLEVAAFAGALLLAVLIGAGIANERGDALGLTAIVAYAAIFLAGVFRRDWLRAHPSVDRAAAAPIFFFTAAFLTNLSLGVCAAIGVAAAVALVLMARRRERRPPAATA